LIELEELQVNNRIIGEELDFFIDYQNEYRSNMCPIDVIPFASASYNGLHFAFLTDFGKNKNLSEAPIICIAPSYDPPVNLVTRNLYEFICLIITTETRILLADRYENQAAFDSRKEKYLTGFRSEQ